VRQPAGEAELYQVEPGKFTAARNALAKQLRAEGRRDEAARVGKLRRPPVTAWALNQVARRQPDLIGAVMAAGGRLRAAMEKAMAGDPSGLRDAQAAQRRAVDAAVAAAVRCLETAGHPGTEAAKHRMGATMGAAVVDEAVAEQLRDGVLEGDRSAPGFGLDAISVAGPLPIATKPVSQGQPRARREETDAVERERRRQARSLHATLEAEANRLAHRAERLQARAEEAERQAAEARAAADAATAEADDARRRAEAARPGDIGQEPDP
jgi:hypothetical protein